MTGQKSKPNTWPMISNLLNYQGNRGTWILQDGWRLFYNYRYTIDNRGYLGIDS